MVSPYSYRGKCLVLTTATPQNMPGYTVGIQIQKTKLILAEKIGRITLVLVRLHIYINTIFIPEERSCQLN